MTHPTPPAHPAARPSRPGASRRAYRDLSAPIAGGVASGLAQHLALPVLWVRGFFVATAFLGGFGLMLYAGLWVFMPADQHFEVGAPGLESSEADGAGRQVDRVDRSAHDRCHDNRAQGDSSEAGDDNRRDGAGVVGQAVQREHPGDQHEVLQGVASTPGPGPAETEPDLQLQRCHHVQREGDDDQRSQDGRELLRRGFALPLLFSRSLILVLEKR